LTNFKAKSTGITIVSIFNMIKANCAGFCSNANRLSQAC